MKWRIAGIVLMLAGVAMGQTTRPSSAPLIIAQLKEENARLKAEIFALKEALAKLDAQPAATGPAEYPSIAAFIKAFPARMIRRSGDTQLQDQQKMYWARDNINGKLIRVTGELVWSEADEIGQIELQLTRNDSSPTIRSEITAKFTGTESQRRQLVSIERGQSVTLTGKISDAMPISNGDGVQLVLKIDDCQLAK